MPLDSIPVACGVCLLQVSRVELLDEVMMHAINHANGYSYKEQPTLMYELVGNTEEHVHEQVRLPRPAVWPRLRSVLRQEGSPWSSGCQAGASSSCLVGEEDSFSPWRLNSKGHIWALVLRHPPTGAFLHGPLTLKPVCNFPLHGLVVLIQVVTVEGVVGKNNGSDFIFAKTEAAKKDLWRARKEALWAGYTLRPGTEPLITVSPQRVILSEGKSIGLHEHPSHSTGGKARSSWVLKSGAE